MTTTLTKVLIVGCGAMAREHIKRILPNFKNTVIPIICEPSNEAYLETIKIFKENNRPEPINEPDLKKALIKENLKVRCLCLLGNLTIFQEQRLNH